MPPKTTLGQDIRALRTARKMTLDTMARALGKSVGWLSQVERGLSSPSIRDLHSIAGVLEVQTSLFFGVAEAPENERGLVVRATARRDIGARDDGLVETLLSPDLTDEFEVIHSTFLPHAQLDDPRQRATCELVYLVSGKLQIEIAGQSFTITAGDSFRIKGAAYRWANPFDDPAVAIWVISPPVY